jgi:hypothetical protein
MFSGKPDAPETGNRRRGYFGRNSGGTMSVDSAKLQNADFFNPSIPSCREARNDQAASTPGEVGISNNDSTESAFLRRKESLDDLLPLQLNNQVKVVITHFGSPASEVTIIQQKPALPQVENSDHVLIKVQVRIA